MKAQAGRLLITGANGFLGKSLVSEALAAGYSTIAVSRNGMSGHYAIKLIADLEKETLPKSAFESVRCIIHAAGFAHQHGSNASNGDFHSANTAMVQRVVEAAVSAKVPRFVLVSSKSVYGHHKDPVAEDAECKPEGAYAVSKLEGEKVARSATDGTDTELLIVRPATLFGPCDPGNFGRMALAIKSGRFFIPGSGENMKSLSDVRITAKAIIALVN